MSAESVLTTIATRRGWDPKVQLSLLCRFIERENHVPALETFLNNVSDASEDSSFDVVAWSAHENKVWVVDRAVPGRAIAQKRAMVRAQQYKESFGISGCRLIESSTGKIRLITTTEPELTLAEFGCEPTPE